MGRMQEMGKDRSESALSGKRIRGERKGCQKCRGEGALHRNKVVARIFLPGVAQFFMRCSFL